MENKYHAFYVDLPHKDFTQLTNNIVENYTVDKYLITAEKTQTGIEHYHFLIYCTQNTYAAIMQKLKSDYSLKGKAEKDGRRQYGKLRKIANLDRLKIYMLKDWKEWNLIKTNLDKNKIEQLHALSFKKNEKFAMIEIKKKEFQEYIKYAWNLPDYSTENVKIGDYILRFTVKKDVSVEIPKMLKIYGVKVWTYKDNLRPPPIKTLLWYARPIIGELHFLNLYYQYILQEN